VITGFTKTKSSDFVAADFDAIFANIKTYLSGANIIENTAESFRFGPMGSVAGNDPDDTPFYKITTDYGFGLKAQAYVAESAGAIGSKATASAVIVGTLHNSVQFACSQTEGWWWMVAKNAANSENQIYVGTPFCRVAADMTTGIHPRFGLLMLSVPGIYAKLPYITLIDGTIDDRLADNDWNIVVASPYGINSATRHQGSTLPRGIAPIYPVGLEYPRMAAAVFGDSPCAMMATDGYAWGEEAAPGWRVFGYLAAAGYEHNSHYMALRSPAVFDVMA